MTEALNSDPEQGVHLLNQFLAFTMQFMSVQQAVRNWLSTLPDDKLLLSINKLAHKPFDWDLLHYSSASLPDKMWHEFYDNLFIIPRRFRQNICSRFNLDISLETTAKAACAGYWLLHDDQTASAVTAFEHVRHLPYGGSLWQSALALAQGQQCASISDIGSWCRDHAWLTDDHVNILRPDVIKTLTLLHQSANEAALIAASASRFSSSAAAGRAVSALTQLLTRVSTICPHPEAPLVHNIADKWRNIFSLAAGDIGELAISEPVANPFVVGNPVTGQLFVGRKRIFLELQETWGNSGERSVDSVIIYGHRRMGKTSILQNLEHIDTGVETLIAQTSMQLAGTLQHSGDLLLFLAVALRNAVEDAGIDPVPELMMDAFDTHSERNFDAYLRKIEKAIGKRRIILTIDEFEEIENAISEGQIEPGLIDFLRGVIHSKPWLIIVLAGSHTLREMTEDYWSPLFASVRPIRVSFLTQSETIELLANPHEDFPFDMPIATINRVFDWVRGQPYLTQLIGSRLVSRYNTQVFLNGEKRAAQFTPDEVDLVIKSSEFFKQGSGYFIGVWGQITGRGSSLKKPLMEQLAWSNGAIHVDALLINTGIKHSERMDALHELIKNDIVMIEKDMVDFTVPLMRIWITEYKSSAQ